LERSATVRPFGSFPEKKAFWKIAGNHYSPEKAKKQV
jgi:hypothetical protein